MQQHSPSANSHRILQRAVHPGIPILMMLYLIVGLAYSFGLSIFLGKAWPMAIYFLGFPFGVWVILKRMLLVTFSGSWANPLAFVYAVIGALILIADIVPHVVRNMGWLALYAMCALLLWGPIIAVIYFICKAVGQRRRSIAAAEHAAFVESLGATDAHAKVPPNVRDSTAWGIGPG